jgi:hypothetical protein
MSWITEFLGVDASRNANKAGQQQASLIQQQLALAQQQQAQMQPYQQQYLKMLADYSSNPDPLGVTSQLLGARQSNDPAYDNAVNSVFSDFAERGMGANSTALRSNVSNIRAQQGSADRKLAVSLNAENEQEKYRRALGMYNSLQGLEGNANSAISQGIGNLGGLQGMYASQSQGALGNLASLGSIFGAGGFLGGKKKRSVDAGDGKYGLSQPGKPLTPMSNWMRPDDWGV